MNQRREPTIAVTIRLTSDVIDRLEAYRYRLEAKTSGLRVTISDAARVAINLGIDSDGGTK